MYSTLITSRMLGLIPCYEAIEIEWGTLGKAFKTLSGLTADMSAENGLEVVLEMVAP